MDYLEQGALWATRTGVDAAADVYGYGRDAYNDARDAVGTASSIVDAGVDIAGNTAQYGIDAVERGVAGALPTVIDHAAAGAHWAGDAVERPINWATNRATHAASRVAGAAADAWSWMTD
ncbi:MAG: hypothetical protein AB7T06_43285 [Kofleriaceae bacterium]